jgi:DNA-binding transcriptional ArsR family regulator
VRPLFHPRVEEIKVGEILHALSDPVRAALFVDIVEQRCPRNCTEFLRLRNRSMPKSTLSQQLRVLREAGLVRGERHGVEMRNTSRCAEIEGRFPGLLGAILTAHTIQWNDEARAKNLACP